MYNKVSRKSRTLHSGPTASSPHLARIPMRDITDYIPRAGIHISAAILQLTWRSICSCYLVSMQLLRQGVLKCLCGYRSWAIDVFWGGTVPYSAMGRWGPRQKAVTTGIFPTVNFCRTCFFLFFLFYFLMLILLQVFPLFLPLLYHTADFRNDFPYFLSVSFNHLKFYFIFIHAS